ncbi:hypothetical protein [Candidatus Binatus sp.]
MSAQRAGLSVSAWLRTLGLQACGRSSIVPAKSVDD